MSPPIPPRHCARFREERRGSKQSGYYSGGGGWGGVSRSVTGWGRGGGGRAGDDIKFWRAQFDGTTPPHFPFCCGIAHHPTLDLAEWGSGLILTYDVKHMSSTLLVYPVFMYIV